LPLRYPRRGGQVNLAGLLLGVADLTPDRSERRRTGAMACGIRGTMPRPDRPDLRLRGEALLIVLLQITVLLAGLV
jgi:hypothetical protein